MNASIKSSLFSATLVLWSARVAGTASLGILALFMIGEGFNPMGMKSGELLLSVCFPLTVMLGLLVGWKWETLGGALTVGGLMGFYALHHVFSGTFPKGWAFAIIAAPGLLFLLAGFLGRRAQRRAA